MRNYILVTASLILLSTTSVSAKELECSALQGAGKVGIGALVGGTVAVAVTWGVGIVAAPFSAGSSLGAAFYGTPAAAVWGAKGGAILGGYSEATDCILSPFQEKGR